MPLLINTCRLLVSAPQLKLGMNRIKRIISPPNPRSTTRQMTIRKPNQAGARNTCCIISSPHMASGLLCLPPFLENDADVLFAQVEARFHIHKIDSDGDQFCTILAAIEEPNVLTQVSDCYRIHQHEISISLSRLNSLHALVILRFSDC